MVGVPFLWNETFWGDEALFLMKEGKQRRYGINFFSN